MVEFFYYDSGVQCYGGWLCVFLQLRGFFSFTVIGRVGLAAGVAVGFGVLTYCVVAYPLAYQYSLRRHSEMFIVRTKYRLSSFFAESLCSTGRNFLRAALHALFLIHYPSQILALTILDTLLIFFLLLFRKSFLNRPIFLVCLVVNLGYFVIDLTLLLRNRGLVRMDEAVFEVFFRGAFLGVVGTILLLSVLLMGFAAWNSVMGVRTRINMNVPKARGGAKSHKSVSKCSQSIMIPVEKQLKI